MAWVTELGYIGFTITNKEEWLRFGQEIIGWEHRQDREENTLRWRMDYWHHRITMHVGEKDDLAYLGWRVNGPKELEALAKRLEEHGFPVRWGSQELCDQRHVLGMFSFQDPAGNPSEVFYGPEIEFNRPFRPGRGMHGRFLTENEGIGHCIARMDDIKAGLDFYGDVLGMVGGIQYKIPMPGAGLINLYFFACNPRQHSIAFGDIPVIEPRINHLMLEYDNLDDVGLAYDLVKRRDIPLMIDLGKHANDQMYSFYAVSPSGWAIELGWGARKAYEPFEFYKRDVYGHQIAGAGPMGDLELDM